MGRGRGRARGEATHRVRCPGRGLSEVRVERKQEGQGWRPAPSVEEWLPVASWGQEADRRRKFGENQEQCSQGPPGCWLSGTVGSGQSQRSRSPGRGRVETSQKTLRRLRTDGLPRCLASAARPQGPSLPQPLPTRPARTPSQAPGLHPDTLGPARVEVAAEGAQLQPPPQQASGRGAGWLRG